MDEMNKTKPEGFEDALTVYGPVIWDSDCGEVVAWGFKIVERLGEKRWAELGKHGKLEYIGNGWALVTKALTREDAEKKYGALTDEKFGPRGGWKSVTFGEKTFMAKQFRPY